MRSFVFSSLCFLSFHFLFFLFSNESSQFWTIRRREKSLIIIIIIFLKPIHINASKRSLSSNERNDIVIILRVNNSALEFPFATKEKGEIVFNSIHVDPPINTSRTTKDLRLEEKIIRAKITAIDARSLRSAVVGLIDSIALVVETVERCER